MSSITSILLICGISETMGGAVGRLNRRLEEHERLQPFASLTDGEDDLPTVYLSRANYLDRATLVEVIESVAWRRPRELQLFLKGEDADTYVEQKLDPLMLGLDTYYVWVSDPDGKDYDPFTETAGNWETRSDPYIVTQDGRKIRLSEQGGRGDAKEKHDSEK